MSDVTLPNHGEPVVLTHAVLRQHYPPLTHRQHAPHQWSSLEARPASGPTTLTRLSLAQALGGLLCWVASVAWSLLQLQAGSVDGGGFLSAWMVGSASLLLQAWVLVRWERHKRRTFLRLLHQRSSSSSSSSCCKPSSNCAGEEAASEGVADAPVACCCFGAAAQAAAKLP